MYEELIKHLRIYANDQTDEIRNEAADAIEHLLNELTETSHEMQKQMCRADGGRWIPVTERLPDGDSPYIAYLKAPDDWEPHEVLSYVTMLEFDKRQMLWWQSENSCFNADIDIVSNDYKVTHWMPRPEPPKEKT